MRFYGFASLLATANFAQHAFCAPQAAGHPTVTIGSGVVVGTTTTFASATAPISKYVGIPFAAPPLGNLRFASPKPAASWTTQLKAVHTKAACLQQFNYPEASRNKTMTTFNNPGFPPPAESEDCLYLNVYVPPGTKKSDAKAVMFWIFGGDLQFGTGGIEPYDGSSFATNQDVIVVTHNYRTNVFGFPNSPQLSSPNQNPGYLDQRFALAWVRENIAAFGGDPDRVTIFGESAGGYSVKQMVALPPKPLPFRAAILESEASSFTGNGTVSWEELVEQLGCTTAASQISCVRTKPAKSIISVIENKMLDFAPVNDGVTQSNDVRTQFDAGTAAKVPFIIGTNENEGRPFVYVLGGEDSPTVTLASLLAELLPGLTALQGVLNAQYGALHGNAAYLAASEVLTQLVFLCPASMLASYAQQRGYAVHRYLFNATFPNTQIFPDAGVWHSSEIPEVFGTYPVKNSLGPATTQEIKLSQYMQTAWANFAKNPAAGPGQGWSALGSAGHVNDLGGHGSNGGKLVSAASLDTSCAMYAAVIDAEGL